MQKITPFLWFDNQAEEAMNYYCSIFKDSKVGEISRWGEGSGFEPGSAMSVSFTLNGQDFIGLNAGPMFKFNEAISFMISCKGQAEVDELWEKLSAGGEESRCGWVKDKFGLWWQVTPVELSEALANKDPEKAKKAMQAMMKMKKIIIKDLV